MSTITRGIQVGFTAARMERRGLHWLSARELAVDEPRWAVRHRHDYGHVTQLPDIAAWVDGMKCPVAIVCEETRRRDDRQTWRLEGWRDAIAAGRYDFVQYDCSHEHLAAWLRRLGKKINFDRPQLCCVLQLPPEKIAARGPYEPRKEPEPAPVAFIEKPPPPEPPPITREPPQESEPEPESPEQYEVRKEHYRELMGSYDSFEAPEAPKRRWFR